MNRFEDKCKALIKWFDSRRGKSLKLNNNGINIVISALEKQIPKKYIRNNGNYDCPVCGFPVMDVCARKKKYCDHCGQAIDWSEQL